MEERKKDLFMIACRAVKDAVNNRYDPPKIVNKFKEKKGVFVTLTKNKELRGCIGTILPIKELGIATYENAIHAAIHDPRFPPLTREELREIEIEISILSNPRRVEYKNVDELLKKIEPHRHGIIISYNGYSATFLPQVWEQLNTKEKFLSHLCLKAGLPMDFWKTGKLIVEVYENEEVIGPWKIERK